MDVSNPEAPAELRYEQVDDIAFLVLDRPHARNAVSFVLWEQFSAALDMIERGTPPRAVVLNGAGNFFSAGGDVKTSPARGNGALSQASRLELGQRAIARLRALPAFTIAAVEGRAIGLGWSLALACDLVVAADDAIFSAPFLNLGLVPDGGFSWLLSQQIGRYRAAEIIVTGRPVGAAEACGLGLVSRLAAPGTAVAVATEMASRFGGDNRHSLELAKRLVHLCEGSSLSGIHAAELAAFQILSKPR